MYLDTKSIGDRQDKFIMAIDKDKIEQLIRESHKDRPKSEVDLNLIDNEILSEDKLKKKEEDREKLYQDRIKKRKLPSQSHKRANGLETRAFSVDKQIDKGYNKSLRNHRSSKHQLFSSKTRTIKSENFARMGLEICVSTNEEKKDYLLVKTYISKRSSIRILTKLLEIVLTLILADTWNIASTFTTESTKKTRRL